MPEDKDCKLLQAPRSSDKNKKKKKKKKGKKVTASPTLSGNRAKHHVVSLPPETLPVSSPPPQCLDPSQGQLPKLRITGKTNGEQLAGSCRRTKKQLKDSLLLLTVTNENRGGRAPIKGSMDELSARTMESLRWDGVLEDPQAEEKRLELYRANRRQRYISHREALLKENQLALKQTLPNESKENMTSTDQQEQSVN